MVIIRRELVVSSNIFDAVSEAPSTKKKFALFFVISLVYLLLLAALGWNLYSPLRNQRKITKLKQQFEIRVNSLNLTKDVALGEAEQSFDGLETEMQKLRDKPRSAPVIVDGAFYEIEAKNGKFKET